MMTHKCKIQCLSVDQKLSELTGQEDPGKWMDFIFDMEIVDAAKLTSDDPTRITYGCTTIFCSSGETFILDTPFEIFSEKFQEYNHWVDDNETTSGEGDLNL